MQNIRDESVTDKHKSVLDIAMDFQKICIGLEKIPLGLLE
jgi:hypothetical protein